MFSFSKRIFLATLLFTLAVHAEEPLLTLEDAPPEPEIYKPYKIWAAIPVGSTVGFGLGQVIQKRSLPSWLVPLAVDATLFHVWFVTSFAGTCRGPERTQAQIDDCHDSRTRFRKNLETAMIVSRLVQAVDLSIWSAKYYKKFHVTAFVIPNEKGQQITLAFEF